jgi:transmembrane sensor
MSEMIAMMDMDDLLIKYVLGEATPEERVLVDQWLAADGGNRAQYEQFRMLWSISRQTAAPVTRNSGAALQRFRQRVEEPRQRVEVPGQRRPGTQRGKRLMAAAFAGALLLGAGGYYMTRPVSRATAISRQQDTVIPWQQVVANNSFRPDTLPDGSIVTLNRHSSLMWTPTGHDPATKNSHRGMTLQLEGEAFFSVAHDPARSFVVRVNDMTVSVLGTSFDIRSTGKDTLTIIVETGSVRVTRGNESLVVHADEQVSLLRTGRLHRQPNTNTLYGYYLDRPLICDSVSLKEVVEMLNKAYDAHVVIGRPELNDLPLTTVFHHEPLEKILAIIGATFDLTVVKQGNSIILQ